MPSAHATLDRRATGPVRTVAATVAAAVRLLAAVLLLGTMLLVVALIGQGAAGARTLVPVAQAGSERVLPAARPAGVDVAAQRTPTLEQALWEADRVVRESGTLPSGFGAWAAGLVLQRAATGGDTPGGPQGRSTLPVPRPGEAWGAKRVAAPRGDQFTDGEVGDGQPEDGAARDAAGLPLKPVLVAGRVEPGAVPSFSDQPREPESYGTRRAPDGELPGGRPFWRNWDGTIELEDGTRLRLNRPGPPPPPSGYENPSGDPDEKPPVENGALLREHPTNAELQQQLDKLLGEQQERSKVVAFREIAPETPPPPTREQEPKGQAPQAPHEAAADEVKRAAEAAQRAADQAAAAVGAGTERPQEQAPEHDESEGFRIGPTDAQPMIAVEATPAPETPVLQGELAEPVELADGHNSGGTPADADTEGAVLADASVDVFSNDFSSWS